MKKLTTLLIICCMALMLTFGLTACGNKCKDHTYDNDCDAICNNCGESREVGAHDYANATCTQPKTCTVCSVTEGEALGHDWIAADCITPKTCRTCGTTDGEALGHTPEDDDGNCKTAVLCSVCDAVVIPAKTEHIAHADDGDCTTAVTCTACDFIFVEAKTHNYMGELQKDAEGHWHVCQNDGCTVTDTKMAHKEVTDDDD